MWVKHTNATVNMLFPLGGIFLFSLGILAVFYFRSVRRELRGWRAAWSFGKTFPLFLSFSMGLALHNGVAVAEGYAGRKSPFLRTPKQGLQQSSDAWWGKAYLESVLNPQTLIEGLLTLYFAAALYFSYAWQDWSMAPLFVLLFAGFTGVSGYSVWHSVGKSV